MRGGWNPRDLDTAQYNSQGWTAAVAEYSRIEGKRNVAVGTHEAPSLGGIFGKKTLLILKYNSVAGGLFRLDFFWR